MSDDSKQKSSNCKISKNAVCFSICAPLQALIAISYMTGKNQNTTTKEKGINEGGKEDRRVHKDNK